jgi:hypothetical protein
LAEPAVGRFINFLKKGLPCENRIHTDGMVIVHGFIQPGIGYRVRSRHRILVADHHFRHSQFQLRHHGLDHLRGFQPGI